MERKARNRAKNLSQTGLRVKVEYKPIPEEELQRRLGKVFDLLMRELPRRSSAEKLEGDASNK
jgi:hypothetical protein